MEHCLTETTDFRPRPPVRPVREEDVSYTFESTTPDIDFWIENINNEVASVCFFDNERFVNGEVDTNVDWAPMVNDFEVRKHLDVWMVKMCKDIKDVLRLLDFVKKTSFEKHTINAMRRILARRCGYEVLTS